MNLVGFCWKEALKIQHFHCLLFWFSPSTHTRAHTHPNTHSWLLCYSRKYHCPNCFPLFQVSQTPVGTPGLVRANQNPSPVRHPKVSQQTLLLGKGLKGSGQDQVLLRAQMVNAHAQTHTHFHIFPHAFCSAADSEQDRACSCRKDDEYSNEPVWGLEWL